MSSRPDNLVFVPPGGLHFGDRVLLRTILGSCVAVLLWHPKRRIGGMCHYVLPARNNRPAGAVLDGRYGDEALAILAQRIERAGTRPEEYQTYLYGGGRMFPGFNILSGDLVGDQNIAMARQLVRVYRLRVAEEDLGGHSYRSVMFDLGAGAIAMHRTHIESSQE